MFRYTLRARVALTLALSALAFSSVSQAQERHTRSRRENANRQARIRRNIEETYSHTWDFAGGGGYLRFRSGEFLRKNNEVTWAVSAARNFSPEWSVVGDVRGSYGNAKVGNNPFNVYKPLITEYTFMAGPQYRFYRTEKWAAAVHVLGGAALGNFDGGTKAFPARDLGMWNTSTAAAFSVGVNIDYNLSPNVAFRLTPTYVGTLFRQTTVDPTSLVPTGTAGGVQNNLGLNVGIVYRWGHK